MDHHCTELKLP